MSEIRDQAYQFFIEEAPELLQEIESGLLTLRQERSTAKVHGIMRAAHSLKGGAASVELDAIKSLAHRLEDYFKALYSDVEIDTELETLLLQAYDCLRQPLMEQITGGDYDAEAAQAVAQPIFAQIEARLGTALQEADNFIPSSADLGIDIVTSIFEIDVAQGLERLETVLASPQNYEVVGEIRAQAEVFAGFAELLNLPGFGRIAQTAIKAIEHQPEQALIVAQLFLADCQAGREAVMAGDRTSGGNPSPALVALTEAELSSLGESAPLDLEDVFGTPEAMPAEIDQPLESVVPLDDFSLAPVEAVAHESSEAADPSLNEIFGAEPALEDEPLTVAPSAEAVAHESSEAADPSLDEIFGAEPALEDDSLTIAPSAEEEGDILCLNEFLGEAPQLDQLADVSSAAVEPDPQEAHVRTQVPHFDHRTVEDAVRSVEQDFDRLPPLEDPAAIEAPAASAPPSKQPSVQPISQNSVPTTPQLSLRVDLNRLERMNNLVGELSINRNGLSLHNEQLQGTVKTLLSRFLRFQETAGNLRELSDQMLIAPMQNGEKRFASVQKSEDGGEPDDFDALEMDSYGEMYSLLQGLLEEIVQLEEGVDDLILFARQSDQTLEQQRQMLQGLQEELMWARMLPLGEVLNRFPRVLRDLSTTYSKPVNLKLSGTGVLVDKAALEKLYDPLLHLLRNAFDHGIEPPDVRLQQGKPEAGMIEIYAYHQGNKTNVEIKDNGRGLNFDKIGRRAVEMGLLSPEQLAVMPPKQLLDFIFEPGFSTASQVSELSGRGVGLDIVRSQLRELKGTIEVASVAGRGTTFTLSLPLTLTLSKLLVCLAGSTAFALPSDGIEDLIVPLSHQIKRSGHQRFLHWRQQIIPVYRLVDILDYSCPLPEAFTSKALDKVPAPTEWACPLLLLRRGQQEFAIEVDRLVAEQELVVKPFGKAIAPPKYIYGCTILGDGTLVPVVDGTFLLETLLEADSDLGETQSDQPSLDTAPLTRVQASTVLVVDDSATLRRTLALTLQKVGYRVLQAKDGREALDKLQQSTNVQLVICDIEMPQMNGFEFLSQRRRESQLLKVPVAMLTSRSNQKHRQLAMHLGANAYFTKPYIEQEFLEAIKQIIQQASQPVGVKS